MVRCHISIELHFDVDVHFAPVVDRGVHAAASSRRIEFESVETDEYAAQPTRNRPDSVFRWGHAALSMPVRCYRQCPSPDVQGCKQRGGSEVVLILILVIKLSDIRIIRIKHHD